MSYITLKWLKKKKACEEAIQMFKKKFGRKATIKQIIDYFHEHKREGWLMTQKLEKWEGWLMARELEMTTAMIDNGANIHADNDWALRSAVWTNKLDVVKFLVKKGADIHTCMNEVLDVARVLGYFDVARALRHAE